MVASPGMLPPNQPFVTPDRRRAAPHRIAPAEASSLPGLACKAASNAARAAVLLPQITNALGHVESCLQYMSLLRQPNIFKFCTIPQVSTAVCSCWQGWAACCGWQGWAVCGWPGCFAARVGGWLHQPNVGHPAGHGWPCV